MVVVVELAVVMRTWLRKGDLKRETEFLLRAAQNNAIKTNNVKARIDKTQ